MTRWAGRVVAVPDAGGVARASAAAMLAPDLALGGDASGAAGAARDALAGVEAATDAELAAAAGVVVAVPYGLLALERLEDGLAVARRAAEVVRRSGNYPAAVTLDVAAVLALGRLGRIDEAVEAADEAEQAARMADDDESLQWALWMRAWVLAEQGELGAALAAAQESVDIADRLDDAVLATIAGAVLGAIHVALGDFESGRPLIARYAFDPGWVCRWAPALVEGDIAAGDLDAAAAHAARASEIAERLGLAGARAAGGYAEALVALARDDRPRAAALARVSADDADRAGATLDAARARLLAGRAAGDLAELAEAERLAAAGGAWRVRDEAARAATEVSRRGA